MTERPEDARRPRVPQRATGVTQSDVTAVVVSHNSAHHLSRLGDTLSASTSPPDRMLAVDNASADATVTRARSAGFEVHETGSNDGFGAACNVGLRLASTEFVLFCNPDVEPSPDAVELLLAALRSNPVAAIAGVAYDKPFLARRFSRISGDVWIFLPAWLQRRCPRFRTEVPVDPREGPVTADYVVGAFMLCRVAALRSVEGFDESFFLYCEEEDLSRRLAKRGWSTLFVPGAEVRHSHSTSSQGVDRSIMAQFLFHSLYLYYRRYHRRAYAELARVIHSCCLVTDRLYRAFTRQPQAYGRGSVRASFRDIDTLRPRDTHG